MSLFGKPRVLASLSDRQQTIIAGVAPISKTLAEWIAGQFVAGRTPDEVWKIMEAARSADVAPPLGAFVARSAYNREVIKFNGTIRHLMNGVMLFKGCTGDGMVKAERLDGTAGEFLPDAFAGIVVERG